ncbi:hypothetical protein RYX56_05695 [Alkalihalophilus lindianensis]|uniref:Phage tail protein n=1 Tax=Alkalihalophilus lindianensis TaxID=1630542 RepID=A0ABU3X965_9BACI|nr:major tail protein [Alkalihalophilus lindianensis]MDV2683802.1 hypothetical protein [Alkalihalophilus lindianensis]MDV2683868.1 hypothetical protein [Alkalihalophilus lindianensis]
MKKGSSMVGLRDLVYSVLDTDDKTGATYGEVKPFAPAISASVNTGQESATQYADNGPIDVITQTGETTLTVGTNEIIDEVLAEILGQTLTKGVIAYKQDVTPPWVAFGFKGTKANGEEKFVWLTKGRFSIPSNELNTKTQQPNFQDASITGTFIRRDYDEVFKITGDTDAEEFADFKDLFFEEVFDLSLLNTTPEN